MTYNVFGGTRNLTQPKAAIDVLCFLPIRPAVEVQDSCHSVPTPTYACEGSDVAADAISGLSGANAPNVVCCRHFACRFY